MLRTLLKCKIHQATITDASLSYVGSMTIPEDLMAKLDIVEGEQVQIANINNGERWTTYAIPGKTPGHFTLNGAAARLGQIGDRIIIMIYGQYSPDEMKSYRPRIAFMDEKNNLVRLQD